MRDKPTPKDFCGEATVSKAADKSNKRSITDSLLSIAHRMSFWTLTKAVSVE